MKNNEKTHLAFVGKNTVLQMGVVILMISTDLHLLGRYLDNPQQNFWVFPAAAILATIVVFSSLGIPMEQKIDDYLHIGMLKHHVCELVTRWFLGTTYEEICSCDGIVGRYKGDSFIFRDQTQEKYVQLPLESVVAAVHVSKDQRNLWGRLYLSYQAAEGEVFHYRHVQVPVSRVSSVDDPWGRDFTITKVDEVYETWVCALSCGPFNEIDVVVRGLFARDCLLQIHELMATFPRGVEEYKDRLRVVADKYFDTLHTPESPVSVNVLNQVKRKIAEGIETYNPDLEACVRELFEQCMPGTELTAV